MEGAHRHSHELDERSVLGKETKLLELPNRESGKSITEQIQLNPLLVEGKGKRLVVEVALGRVHRGGRRRRGVGSSS